MSKEDMMKGRGLVKGIAEGEALVSRESLVWSHGVDPETGKIDDVRVSVCGQCVKRQDTHLSAGKRVHQRSHLDAGGSQVRKRT